ncbi:MAG: hypothetical protein MHM6MM_009189 [Cercozoa sp. M6MM]
MLFTAGALTAPPIFNSYLEHKRLLFQEEQQRINFESHTTARIQLQFGLHCSFLLESANVETSSEKLSVPSCVPE